MHICIWPIIKKIRLLVGSAFLFALVSMQAIALAVPNLHSDTNILHLDPFVKGVLDREIRPIRNKVDRALALHKLMFERYSWNIHYSADKTFTAQETFENGHGNCISLAALYVASARYVGLPAKFQSVEVDDNWTPQENFYFLSRHINVNIRFPGETMHIEFLQAFFDIEIKEVRKKVVSDEYAFAEYHNNVAMDLMSKKDYVLAEKHIKIALKYNQKSDAIWSNYGVLDKFNNRPKLAEQRYKKALKINRRNLSALTNIYVLYHEQGRFDEAEKIAKKVEKYSRKNPYHLAKLAERAYSSKELASALKLIDKAIRKSDEVAIFHKHRAKYLLSSGNKKAALKALNRAKIISEALSQKHDIAAYQRKIDGLISTM